jgi:hypothetical protein
MTERADDFLVFTVGPRARDAIVGSPVASLRRSAEGLLDQDTRQRIEQELESIALASVVVDVRDLNRSRLTQDIVPFLRNRLPLPPLVVLDVPAALDAAWPFARLVAFSRGLRAPVVRAAAMSGVPTWQVASLVREWLGPGVTCSDSRDVELVFAPACGAFVFRWSPWRGDEATPVPAPLADALRSERVESVFVTYRFPPSGTLQRIDATIARIAAAATAHANVLFASPTIDAGEEEALVTIIHADRR